MKTAKIISWYLGVTVATVLLVSAVLMHNVVLSLVAVAGTIILKRTNKYIPIPKAYAQMGITNDLFQGEMRHEKNHQ
jgi:hypothetical protein